MEIYVGLLTFPYKFKTFRQTTTGTGGRSTTRQAWAKR
jgi:hypothetical protein